MRTKIFTILFTLVASVGTIFSWNYDFARIPIDGLYYNLNKSDSTAEVSYQSYSNYTYNEDCTITSANIPNSVVYEGKTYRVTRIGNYAFKNCYSLESVHLGENIIFIGEQAFIDCNSLSSINFPESIESIERCAFQGCISLNTVIIPNKVKTISAHSFNGCSGIISLTLGNNVLGIGYRAFYGCKGLTSIVIPDGVVRIEYDAFGTCNNLSSVTIPKSVVTVGDDGNGHNAFNTTAVKKIYFTGDIGDWCRKQWAPQRISKDYKLYFNGILQQNITLPDSIKEISKGTFRGCGSLQSIILSDSVTIIGNSAFYGCYSLKSITIPANVDELGYYVFKGCTSLTSITWNVKKRMKLCENPFYMKDEYNISKQIVSFTFGDEVEWIQSFLCQEMTQLSSITIPNSVTFIHGNAFRNCSSLTSVIIPSNVTTVSSKVFEGCSRLKEIIMLPETPPYEGGNIVADSVPIYVPCGTLEAYRATSWSNYNVQYQPYSFEYRMISSEPHKGSVNIKAGNSCEAISLSAVSNEGYYFVKWSDGNSDNPRTIILTQDTTIAAIFGPFIVSFVDDNDTILSSQEYEYGAIPVPPANPVKTNNAQYFYTFAGWTPQIVPVTSDATYKATYTATEKTETIIDNVIGDVGVPTKYIENGNIYIIMPNGKKYSIIGELIN